MVRLAGEERPSSGEICFVCAVNLARSVWPFCWLSSRLQRVLEQCQGDKAPSDAPGKPPLRKTAVDSGNSRTVLFVTVINGRVGAETQVYVRISPTGVLDVAADFLGKTDLEAERSIGHQSRCGLAFCFDGRCPVSKPTTWGRRCRVWRSR